MFAENDDPIDSTPVETPTIDAMVDEPDYDAEVSKRGAKNVMEELKRKDKELKSAREEIETFKKTKTDAPQSDVPAVSPSDKRYKSIPHLNEFVNKYKAGVSPEKMAEFIEELVENVALKTSIESSMFHANEKFKTLSKYEQRALNNDLDETVSSLGKKAEFKYVLSKYGDEVKDLVKKQIKPEHWDSEDAIMSIVGMVFAKHLAEQSSTEDDNGTVKKPVLEQSNSSAGGLGMGGLTQRDLEEAASVGNLDLSNPEERKVAHKLAAARKKRDEAMNSFK